eukprot:2997920-Alexandrium_andersonii.AAC.1
MVPVQGGVFRAVSDPLDVAELVAQHYRDKWGEHNARGRMLLSDFLFASDGLQPHVPREVFHDSFQRIRRKARMDNYGVSVMVLLYAWQARRSVIEDICVRLLASNSHMAQFQ